jgi:hypothetical protein
MKIILNRILCVFLAFILGFAAGHMGSVVFNFLSIDKSHRSNIKDTSNTVNHNLEDIKLDYTILDTNR